MKKIALILIAAIILSTITACQNAKEADNAISEKVTNVYRSDFINLPDNVNSSGSDFYICDEKIYFLCYEILNQETWETRYGLYSIGLDGTGESVNYDIVGGSGYVNNFAILSDGSMTLVKQSYDETAGTQTYNIVTYDKDFNELYSFDPTNLFSNKGEYFYINRMVVSSDDVLYISHESNILAVTPEGQKLFEVTCSGDYINQMSATTDGRIVISYYDYNSARGGYVFQYIDPQKKDFGDIIEIPSSNNYNNYNDTLYFGAGYDFYYKDSTGIYGCHGTEKTLLMNFINSDVNPNSSNSVKIISPDKFLYQGYDYYTDKNQIAILTRIPDDEVVPKKIINMSFLYADTYELTNAVISFNRDSNEYRIVMHDYSQYNTVDDYSQGRDRFNNDIASGNIADIMIMNSDSNMQSYIKKGLFVDMYEFMDDKNVLLQCVRTIYETDGKLYQIPISFYLNALVGKSSIFGDKINWTLNEMIEIIDKYPDSYLMPGMSQTSLLQMLLYYGNSDYINYDKGTCSFDSEEFINILKYIYDMDDESFYEKYENYWENKNSLIADNIVLMDSIYASSFVDFLRMKVPFNNEKITIKGFPSNTSNGLMLNSSSIYTISSKSKVKNGAWEFISYMLSDDVQASSRTHAFPVTESGFYAKAEKEKAQYFFFYLNGSGWSSSESPMDEEWHNREEGVFGNVTDEDVQFVYDLLNQVDTTISIDETLTNIIMEEVEIFLQGQKSAEETAKVIQSRIGIYISENY